MFVLNIFNKHRMVLFPPCETQKLRVFCRLLPLGLIWFPKIWMWVSEGGKWPWFYAATHISIATPLPSVPCICRLYKEIPPLSIQRRWVLWFHNHLGRFSWCRRWCCQPDRGQWRSGDSTPRLRWLCTRSSDSGTEEANNPPLLPVKIEAKLIQFVATH